MRYGNIFLGLGCWAEGGRYIETGNTVLKLLSSVLKALVSNKF